MDIIFAFGHITGAFVVLSLFEIGTLLLANYQMQKGQKQVLLEISSTLGVTIEDLNNKELAPKITAFFLQKFNNDHFGNRLSDLLGHLLTIWKVLGAFIQWGFLIYVVWQTVINSYSFAVYAWFVIPIAVFIWIVSYFFSVLCWLITGRYPGQAKAVRKAVENQ